MNKDKLNRQNFTVQLWGFTFPLEGYDKDKLEDLITEEGSSLLTRRNHGKHYKKSDLFAIIRLASAGHTLSAVAIKAGRKESALVMKIDRMVEEIRGTRPSTDLEALLPLIELSLHNTNTQSNDNMENPMSNNSNGSVDNVINLQITMNEIVDSAIEGLKFYKVQFAKPVDTLNLETEAVSHDHTSTPIYKSLKDLKIGQKVLVSTGPLRIGYINSETEQPANYTNPSYYDWIMQVMDDDYTTCREFERESVMTLKNKVRNQQRESMIKNMLGGKMPKLVLEEK